MNLRKCSLRNFRSAAAVSSLDYEIWSNVQYIGPQFMVIVSAIPQQGHDGVEVETRAVANQAEVVRVREELIAVLRIRLRFRGDRVVVTHRE